MSDVINVEITAPPQIVVEVTVLEPAIQVIEVEINNLRGDSGLDGIDGIDGTGWTSGVYNPATGIVTFTSTDGLGFATDDLRPAFVPADYSLTAQVVKEITGAAYSCLLADADSLLLCTGVVNLVVTLPNDATQALPVGTQIDVIRMTDKTVTFVAQAGATVSRPATFTTSIGEQFGAVTAKKVQANTWVLIGHLGVP